MMERGFKNVRPVKGGGEALEKWLEHYVGTWFGYRIINPITGKVTDIKR